MFPCFTQNAEKAIPIIGVKENEFLEWKSKQSSFVTSWLAANNFQAKPQTFCVIPTENGKIDRVILGLNHIVEMWHYADLAMRLPKGVYAFENLNLSFLTRATLGWALASYQFTRYKISDRQFPQLLLNPEVDLPYIENCVKAIYWVRDVINTPTEEMGPEHLLEALRELFLPFETNIHVTTGDMLLKAYPGVHTVGRASTREPSVIDIRWGQAHHRKLTILGKGVCFDSGGLDIKNSQGMLLMKKDMGGAAHALGLAYMIMKAQLPIQLRILIPAVENVISGNAYRPGDIIRMRSGKTVEIGNTDAEGRVILADVLTAAYEESPELVIDFATLTGAARVALGPELPVFFANDEQIAIKLQSLSTQLEDPIWRLPLHKSYRKYIDSTVADINNSSTLPYAGAITAALFLQEFTKPEIPWVHFDLMAWNIKTMPGRPEGGEAMALRTVFDYLVNEWVGNHKK